MVAWVRWLPGNSINFVSLRILSPFGVRMSSWHLFRKFKWCSALTILCLNWIFRLWAVTISISLNAFVISKGIVVFSPQECCEEVALAMSPLSTPIVASVVTSVVTHSGGQGANWEKGFHTLGWVNIAIGTTIVCTLTYEWSKTACLSLQSCRPHLSFLVISYHCLHP